MPYRQGVRWQGTQSTLAWACSLKQLHVIVSPANLIRMNRHKLSSEGPYAFSAPACDASQGHLRLMRQRLHGCLMRRLVDDLTESNSKFLPSRLGSKILLFQSIVSAVR